MKTNSPSLACALAAILLASAMQTGCASASSAPKASQPIYQPPTLRLQAGQVTQTRDGLYWSPQAEIWHSDARYRQLEAELIDCAAALAQRKAEGLKD
jgi:hypothetical protein